MSQPSSKAHEHGVRLPSTYGPGRLSVTERLRADFDPVGFVPALCRAAASLISQPVPLARTSAQYAGDSVKALGASVLRALAQTTGGPATLAKKDRRYAEPAYTSNAWFWLSRQQDALFAEYLDPLSRARRCSFGVGEQV